MNIKRIKKHIINESGNGKYVYQDEEQEEIKEFMHNHLEHYFPEAKFEYFV
ncbi:spore photoproduct lyase family protein [Alkalibacillus aidingensis]|uniref:spore photoproduct lyase family protein n=1 Tax=Alkalibacillus aidingensis TaxID=2747607 RepID=UPI00374E01AA